MKKNDAVVPVTVLTGFLGSGKTTLINRLLKEMPGMKFGLVVNEFGEASLESQLLETRKRPLYELPSGCLCCVSTGDLLGALDAVRAKDPQLDHILVEASGLSSPGPLLGVLTQDGPYRLSGVFCLADATAFLSHEKEFPALKKQLSFADAVLLTKTDLAAPHQVEAVKLRLAELKPHLKILDSARKLPWSVLFEQGPPPALSSAEPAQNTKRRFFSGGKHHDVTVLEFESPRTLDPVTLGQVFSSLEPGILRAKGIVHVADPSGRKFKYLVQYTGTQKQLYSRPWENGEVRRSSLVFLGSEFDATTLKARLEACQVGP